MSVSEDLHKSEFSIFTSIRFDPILSSSRDNQGYANTRACKLYFPELHRQRLFNAAAHFWPGKTFKELESSASFETALLQAIDEREMLHETFICPMKVKYTFTSTGRTHVALHPVPALSLEALFPSTLKLPSSRSNPTHGSRFGSSTPTTFTPSPYSPTYPRRRGSDDYFSIGSNSTSSSAGSASSAASSTSSRHKSPLQKTYEIWIDTRPTPQDEHTTFKTSTRAVYDEARARVLPDPEDYTQEVLLWNADGLVTEGTVLTPYFYRNRTWVTPAVENARHGGQVGTSRRWALDAGLCEEGTVDRKSIRVGEKVWLSNGVRGFGWGRIQGVKKSDTSSERSY